MHNPLKTYSFIFVKKVKLRGQEKMQRIKYKIEKRKWINPPLFLFVQQSLLISKKVSWKKPI
ncbi:MAG: hypothetical protein B7Y25_05380 [Alphaproteobacteria bacterium 16-39-46]|nr:MAG: hypothetical protein B7Y25_05380 [Alphaproteobacteria bacterium 16-39-46]